MLFLELEFICAYWSSTNNLLHNPLLKQLSLMWSRVGQPRSRVAILSLGRKHGADLDVVATVGLLCPEVVNDSALVAGWHALLQRT